MDLGVRGKGEGGEGEEDGIGLGRIVNESTS